MSGVMNDTVIPLAYLFAAGCFVLALKWLSHPTTAPRGTRTGEIGMLVAVVATLFRFEIVDFRWIAIAVVAGVALGVPLGLLVPMTAVPQPIRTRANVPMNSAIPFFMFMTISP